MSIFSYFYNYQQEEINESDDFIFIRPEEDKKYLISCSDLRSVNLQPLKDIIPNPSRNMPFFDKVNLQNLNKAQLNAVLSVKLRPTIRNQKITYYEPRHPVLCELRKKFKPI